MAQIIITITDLPVNHAQGDLAIEIDGDRPRPDRMPTLAQAVGMALVNGAVEGLGGEFMTIPKENTDV